MHPRSLCWLATLAVLVFPACGSGYGAHDQLCGNGRVDPGETCDDGNREDGDNCPANCVGSLVSFAVDTNACPVLEEATIFPSQSPVGGEVLLSARASDPNGDRIFYDWTGSGGVLTHAANSKRATFVCAFPGAHTITLWVFDSRGCVTTHSLTVTCT